MVGEYAIAERGATAAMETVKSLGGGSAAAAVAADTHAPHPYPGHRTTSDFHLSHRHHRRRHRRVTEAAAVTPFVYVRLCYLVVRAVNWKIVCTGMCTVFGRFSVDLTTSTSMVIHRALQVNALAVNCYYYVDETNDRRQGYSFCAPRP